MKSSKIYLLMFIVTITGSLGSILSKSMNEHRSLNHHFYHPYFQAATIFIGESVCFIIYKFFIKNQENSNQYNEDSNFPLAKKLRSWIFSISALLDLISTTLSYLGLIFSSASVYAMFKSLSIVLVLIFSATVLKRKVYRYQVLGVVLITIGIAIVSVSSVIYVSPTASDPVLGIIILTISQIFNCIFLTSEEKFFSCVNTNPLQAIGIEGICGIFYNLILLPVFNSIPCEQSFCNNGRVENSIFAFKQIFSSSFLLTAWILTIANTIIYNSAGISVTKYASSLSRSLLFSLKMAAVWVISLFLEWEYFIWLELVGFLVIIIGNLVYNSLIIVPFCGFKDSVLEHKVDKEIAVEIFQRSNSIDSAKEKLVIN